MGDIPLSPKLAKLAKLNVANGISYFRVKNYILFETGLCTPSNYSHLLTKNIVIGSYFDDSMALKEKVKCPGRS